MRDNRCWLKVIFPSHHLFPDNQFGVSPTRLGVTAGRIMVEFADWAAVNRNELLGENRVMEDGTTYRVVGILPDGRRVVVDDGMSFDRTRHVRSLLIGASAFPYVMVESEQPSPNDVAPTCLPRQPITLAARSLVGALGLSLALRMMVG